MTISPINLPPSEERKYRRIVLKSLFTSLFWSVFFERREQEGFTKELLADAVGHHQSEIIRWFSDDPYNPTWTLDTIADVADALDIELVITARERSTGRIFTPHGEQDDDKT
jgi:hypothetical protein